MSKTKLSDFSPLAQRVLKHNLATMRVGQRIRYCGIANCGNREGIIRKVVKTQLMVDIQWDVPTGPLDADRFYRAFAHNVEPVT